MAEEKITTYRFKDFDERYNFIVKCYNEGKKYWYTDKEERNGDLIVKVQND